MADRDRARLKIEPREAVQRLQKYRPPPEGREGKLRLDFNENTVGCAPAVVRTLRRALNADFLSRYPEYEEGRAILARYFGVSRQEMLITNGVDDAIKLICDTFVEPGDVLLVPAPTFPIYQFFHGVTGGRTRTVHYDEALRLPAERILRAINKRTRWVALANPNNPTGTLVLKEDLQAVLQAAPRTLFLVDEAYYDFSGETILPWIRQFPNLVVSRTFSKAFGLAGLRLGFLFANANLAGLMRRVHAVFAVNSVAMVCAVEAIRHEDYVRRYARAVCKNRERLCKWLDSMEICYAPSAANFVLACVGRRAVQIARRLREKSILVRDWAYDPHLKNYLRMTVGTSAQTRCLIEALGELQDLIETHARPYVWRDLVSYSAAEYFG
jgi:histidinol-phosphate aminotransferase